MPLLTDVYSREDFLLDEEGILGGRGNQGNLAKLRTVLQKLISGCPHPARLALLSYFAQIKNLE